MCRSAALARISKSLEMSQRYSRMPSKSTFIELTPHVLWGSYFVFVDFSSQVGWPSWKGPVLRRSQVSIASLPGSIPMAGK